MGGIKVVGLEKLQKKLKQNVRMEDVKKVVRHNGAEMQAKAQQKAPVGLLKAGIPGMSEEHSAVGLEIHRRRYVCRGGAKSRLWSLCGTGYTKDGGSALSEAGI